MKIISCSAAFGSRDEFANGTRPPVGVILQGAPNVPLDTLNPAFCAAGRQVSSMSMRNTLGLSNFGTGRAGSSFDSQPCLTMMNLGRTGQVFGLGVSIPSSYHHDDRADHSAAS